MNNLMWRVCVFFSSSFSYTNFIPCLFVIELRGSGWKRFSMGLSTLNRFALGPFHFRVRQMPNEPHDFVVFVWFICEKLFRRLEVHSIFNWKCECIPKWLNNLPWMDARSSNITATDKQFRVAQFLSKSKINAHVLQWRIHGQFEPNAHTRDSASVLCWTIELFNNSLLLV